VVVWFCRSGLYLLCTFSEIFTVEVLLNTRPGNVIALDTIVMWENQSKWNIEIGNNFFYNITTRLNFDFLFYLTVFFFYAGGPLMREHLSIVTCFI